MASERRPLCNPTGPTTDRCSTVRRSTTSDGVYAPVSEKRFALRILGGVGAARTSFAYTATGCVGTAVCTTQTEPVGNTNHFQVHVGAGVQIYLSEHIFIRPQFDFHYVPSLNQQFGSNLVPQGMILDRVHSGRAEVARRALPAARARPPGKAGPPAIRIFRSA